MNSAPTAIERQNIAIEKGAIVAGSIVPAAHFARPGTRFYRTERDDVFAAMATAHARLRLSFRSSATLGSGTGPFWIVRNGVAGAIERLPPPSQTNLWNTG